MEKLLLSIILIWSINYLSIGQPQANQAPDVLIAAGTLNTDLVLKVSGRDGRLYQSYLGSKLGNITSRTQLRDPGHIAYATFGTDNLFEPAIRMTHTGGIKILDT